MVLTGIEFTCFMVANTTLCFNFVMKTTLRHTQLYYCHSVALPELPKTNMDFCLCLFYALEYDSSLSHLLFQLHLAQESQALLKAEDYTS